MEEKRNWKSRLLFWQYSKVTFKMIDNDEVYQASAVNVETISCQSLKRVGGS